MVAVRILPVRVQGAEAPYEIADAIRYANVHDLADVLIVGRGGGSIEDLWAFNDERVALAIYESAIPVISAVGHEPDVTISDYVADLRAATPSNAAELVVPDKNAIYQQLDQYSAALASALSKQLRSARQHLEALSRSNVLVSPENYLKNKNNSLITLRDRLYSAASRIIDRKKQRYIYLSAALDAMSPLKVLTRGYSIVTEQQGRVLRSISQVKPDLSITVQMTDGSFTAKVLNLKENDNER